MVNDSQEKFFCPRLIDYVVVVGNKSPLPNYSEIDRTRLGGEFESSSTPSTWSSSDNSTKEGTTSKSDEGRRLRREPTSYGSSSSNFSRIQSPDLLRRFPEKDHEDFALPKDVVCFCQPEGCITSSGRGHLSEYNKISSFVFTISDKDTVRTRYGVCVNFYRPVRQKYRQYRANTVGSVDYSSSSEESSSHPESSKQSTSFVTEENVTNEHYPKSYLPETGYPSSIAQSRKKMCYYTLTSVCMISHHQFFMAFRECLLYLKSLIDACSDALFKGPHGNQRRNNIWEVIIRNSKNETTLTRLYVCEIEKLILKLLCAPVPVPGKTKVEVELFGPEENRPPLLFALPDHTRFSLLDFPIHLPLELMGVENCIQVVFQSRDYNALSMSVMAFIALLYPLDYMFPVIPLLPISMEQSECLLDNPTPYVVGIPVNFFVMKKHFQLPDDIWLIDLDANKIISPSSGKALPPLPQPDGSSLTNQLRQAVSSLSNIVPPYIPANSHTSSDSQVDNSSVNSSSSVSDIKDHGSRKRSESISVWMTEQQKGGLSENISELKKRESQIGTPNLYVYGSDVDMVDIAVRVAMVRFFNGSNILANLVEHIRTIRLFPRPVVALQSKSFLQSRENYSEFVKEFCQTQAVEYFAEWSLTPSNVAFQRVHTGVFDPVLIGDKPKWFAESLESITYQVWNKSGLLDNVFKHACCDTPNDTDESGVDSDGINESSSASSDNDMKSGNSLLELQCREQIVVETAVYNPPTQLQIPETVELSNSPSTSSESSSSDAESDLESPEFQPSSVDLISLPPKHDPGIHSVGGSAQWSQSLCSEKINSGTVAISSRKSSQEALFSQVDKAKIVSKSLLDTNKRTAAFSKNTIEDLACIGKSTLGGLTRSAKQVASKTKLSKASMLVEQNTQQAKNTVCATSAADISRLSGKEFLSNIGQDINDIAAQTSNIFTDFFGNKNKSKPLLNDVGKTSNSQLSLPGQKVLAENSHLIHHSAPIRSNSYTYLSTTEKALNSQENQAFLADIAHQILEGEGVSWMKINRCKKLLEDENNRCFLLNKLNKTLHCKTNPSDHVEDAYVSRSTWKSMLKLLQLTVHGIEISFANSSSRGLASSFHLLEIMHTHYWSKDGANSGSSGIGSQDSTPFGSHDNLPTPTSPINSSHLVPYSRESSEISILGDNSISTPPSSFNDNNALIQAESIPKTKETLKDLFNRKKQFILSKMSSVDGERTNETLRKMSSDQEHVLENDSTITKPFLQRMHKNRSSIRSTVSDSEIEQNSVSRYSRQHVSSTWSSKSSLSAGFRYYAGAIHNTIGVNSPECSRTYLFEGMLGSERSILWDNMDFWEESFIDAVSYERDIIGMDQGHGELMGRYKHLNESEQKKLAHDEDKLLSTMLYNMTAFMLMMNVKKEFISPKVRSLLGKCRIAICYAEEITKLLCKLTNLHGNDIDLKYLASRLGHGQSFAVHIGTDAAGQLLFIEVRDDGLVMRSVNGVICERWWYERVINMTYSPKNKIVCLWKKVGGQTSLHKYYAKKSKQLYLCIKSAMERVIAQGQHLGQTVELGGEFPVQDICTGEGGLLQVCMEGVGLLFSSSKFFVKLRNIKKCFTVKGKYFVLEEYNPKKRLIMERKYESTLSGQICYSILCVFSYAAAVEAHKNTSVNHSVTPIEFTPPKNYFVSQ